MGKSGDGSEDHESRDKEDRKGRFKTLILDYFRLIPFRERMIMII